MEDLFDISRKFLEQNNQAYVRKFIKEDPFKTELSVLLGQRGIGKTTSIVQYMLRQYKGDVLSNKMLYLVADHFAMKNRALYEIAENFYKLGGELLCIDEIHKYYDWSMELKSIYDTFPKLKVIASGSSALAIYKGSHDLSRRALKYHLTGFSFREYLEMKTQLQCPDFKLKDILEHHEKIARDILIEIESRHLKILPLFKDYLRVGFYPYSMRYQGLESRFNTTLEQNLHTTLEGDLLALYPSLSGVSTKKIKQLVMYLISHTPYKVELSKLRRILEIHHDKTLKTYLKYLEDAEIINTLCHEGKSLASFDKPEKIYLNNTNQMYALGGEQTNVGSLRETFFMNALSQHHTVTYSEKGDFNVEGFIFEIGGKNKTFHQIKNLKKSYLAIDNEEIGIENKIPLWLFGFLY